MAAKKRKTAHSATKTAANATKTSNKELKAIILFAVALFLMAVVVIKGEKVWTQLHSVMLGIFGVPAFLYPILLGFFAVALVADKKKRLMPKAVESSIFLVFLNAFISACSYKEGLTASFGEQLENAYKLGAQFKYGGWLGALIGNPLCNQLGKVPTIITLLILLFVLLMIVSGTGLISFLKAMSKPVKAVSKEQEERQAEREEKKANTEDTHKKGKIRILKGFDVDIPVDDEPVKPSKEETNDIVEESNTFIPDETTTTEEPVNEEEEKPKKPKKIKVDFEKETAEVTDEINSGFAIPHYKYPPYELLSKTNSSDVKTMARELDNTAERLVEVLRSFGVETKILDISKGPTVTRYELQPCAGVKISKITGLADDIALNLATAGVRIEAPIPNKAAVGIEVPNKASATVGVREIIESSSFCASKSKLTVAMGRDIGGNVVIGDIAKMPHGLIAGATGSGKSVCINSIVMSILYKATPDEVKLLMIDPKVVELGVYNGIPHLLVPVVTDPKKAAGALGWAVTEMEKRYAMFADRSVRDIEGYNRFVDTLVDEPEVKKMPHIVIIIDELADLMMTAPNEVEDSINRIAAKARAAGMHLLIATQRPSVDVVTGVIKANIPTRIAFAVSSQIDSRTILDAGGAEKLLGKGDMLFSPIGSTKPKRVQGCFVTDKEVDKVVAFVKKAASADYDEDIMFEIERQAAIEKSKKTGLAEDGPGDDPLLNDAIMCVIENGQASTSLLQRKLKLGYARAARIVDEMETRGVVGPYEGSKPRKVLITMDQFMEQQATSSDSENEIE